MKLIQSEVGVVNTIQADADWMQSLSAVDDKSILMED